MANLGNTNIINSLADLTRRAPTGVLQAIKGAAVKTGVNFAYMVQQAAAESSFNPAAKAKTSSASGLYQFIESTWLSMVDKYGAKHGINTEGMTRQDILALRNDPETACLMAAEFAGENEQYLKSHCRDEIGATELYFAHFMGAGGAAKFLNARVENPQAQAATLFPAAARANRNVFYDTKTGQPKTLDEVYAFFDKKFKIEGGDIPDIQSPAAKNASARPSYASSVFVNTHYAQANNNIWDIGDGSTRSYAPLPYQSLVNNPAELMLLSQLELPIGNKGSVFK